MGSAGCFHAPAGLSFRPSLFTVLMINWRICPMNIAVNDLIETKKPHPCGGKTWLVLRVGMDFRLRCTTCGRELMIPRAKAEKSIRKVLPHPAE